MRIYLVGGAVRDELMGRGRCDKDYAVIGADEDRFMRQFPDAKKVGRRKCVFLLNGDEYTLSPFDTIEEDLLRRDLTVNAFAKDMEGHIIGHPSAFEDLKNKRLRPVAAENFVNDPLRVFRAARFAAELPEFQADALLLQIMTSVSRKGLLAGIAAERVGNEVRKACGSPWPSRFFTILQEADALTPWFEELAISDEIPAGPVPYHEGCVFRHLMEVADYLKGDALSVWMAICHDLGKTATEKEKWPAHHRHGDMGESMARRMGIRLRMPQRFIRAGAAASRWHMTAGRYDTLRVGTRVDLLFLLHRMKLIHEMFRLVQADKGMDFSMTVKRDLEILLAVRLPQQYKGLGAKSGRQLHRLRCRELKAATEEGACVVRDQLTLK